MSENLKKAYMSYIVNGVHSCYNKAVTCEVLNCQPGDIMEYISDQPNPRKERDPMPFPKTQHYTINDIYNLPEGHRAELINGQIYDMAPPSTAHQRILSFLHLEIGSYIREHNGSCEVIPAPFAVFLENENNSTDYLEPDISVICDPDKIDDKGCHGSPDWIIEIVSPSSKRMDYYTKLTLYRANGVREYWIVDPLRKTIVVYDTENDDGPILHSLTDTIKTKIYDDLEIDFSKLHI